MRAVAVTAVSVQEVTASGLTPASTAQPPQREDPKPWPCKTILAARAAPVYFVSPAQVNVLAPNGTAQGNVAVVVTNTAGSDTFRAVVQDASPALFTFSPRDNRYAAAVRLDGAFRGPAGLYGDAVGTVPARAGEVILLFGTGCGATASPVPTDVFA